MTRIATPDEAGWSRKAPLYRAYRCPHCGNHVTSKRGARGRPRSAFYAAEGKTLHANAWAAELNVSTQTVKNYHKRFPTFEEAVRAIRNRYGAGAKKGTP